MYLGLALGTLVWVSNEEVEGATLGNGEGLGSEEIGEPKIYYYYHFILSVYTNL